MKRRGLVLVVAGVLGLGAGLARAEDSAPRAGWVHELRLGVLAHDVDGLWSGDREEGGVDVNAEIVFARASFQAFWGRMRPNLGVSVNSTGDTSKAYLGLLWEVESRSGFALELGVGAAIHNGKKDSLSDEDRKKLGTRVLFRIPIAISYSLNEHHRFSLAFDHISNAGFDDENEGLDTIGLRYGFRF